MSRRLPLPAYLDSRGRVRTITGRAAETWPYLRVITHADGAEFVEWPLPSESGWGLTFHVVRRRSWWNVPGRFVDHYVEGRASGFPWWPVVVYSTRWAIKLPVRSLFRKGAPRP